MKDQENRVGEIALHLTWLATVLDCHPAAIAGVLCDCRFISASVHHHTCEIFESYEVEEYEAD